MQLISFFSREGGTLSRNEKVAMFWESFEVPTKMGILRQKYRSSPKKERALETLLRSSLKTPIFAAPRHKLVPSFTKMLFTGLFNTPKMHSEAGANKCTRNHQIHVLPKVSRKQCPVTELPGLIDHKNLKLK